jgi:hypothetical protein
MEAEDFLELLWGEGDGWVDLPAKVNGYWIPYPLEWPPEDSGTGVSRRIDQSLRDGEDLYFSVARFSERGRSIEDVLPVGWLWADLDEVHPSVATGMGLMPTIAVESSPGRYQAYWRLTKEHAPKVIERLNRGLTYALGADKGGWDLTQVLRIVGTRNQKYRGSPLVRMLWYNEGLVYKAAYVLAKVKEHVPAEELAGVTGPVLPRRDIPRKAKQLLWAKQEEVVKGEGSHKLWELNCLLAESGLEEDEIYALVVVSVWNKWKGMSSGSARLRGDIRKAMTHVRRKAVSDGRSGRRGKGVSDARQVDSPLEDSGGVGARRDLADDSDAGAEGAVRSAGGEGGGDDGGVTSRLRFVSYASFMAMAMEEPKWLIEDIWTAGSHGIIGGEPKTSKTTLAVALALAVASGQPFLGEYAVGTQGPVLMIQEENAPWMMQDRMHKLATYSGLIVPQDARVRPGTAGGLGPTVVSIDRPADEIPLWLMNNCGFDLGYEEHRDLLEGYVAELKPVLVILDPLGMMLGTINLNLSHELQPFLKWLIQLRYQYGCAVSLVHHIGKANQNTVGRRAGQRLLGSTALHGFVDSALYTTSRDDPRDGWTRVVIEREFRAMEPQKPIEMAWHFDAPGSLGMQLEVANQDLSGAILARVREEDGVTVASLAREMELDSRTLLARVRGSEYMRVEGSGRGKVKRIYLTSSMNGDEADE